ncbi:sensor domain-containing diguanylate cyclase [Gammaproteobacteria bacterium AB-CW1]|uniref:diguanylate cyclase n=1 Tax=Natronospira elongata TaxID=3110268 RepID=A0AAP6JHG6_9GAMM|nr:sensor domain-containing diguanylate cyclase [Gammaproteobacteria bacterium AB-CW1]
MAAAMFLFGAFASALGAILLAESAEDRMLRLGFALAACVVAALLVVLPWERGRLKYFALVVPVAFLFIYFYELLVGFSPYTYPLTFVFVYVWVGLVLPRWAPLALFPLMVLTYVAPKLDDIAALQAGVVALPTCLLVGEGISFAMNLLRGYQDEFRQQAEIFRRVALAARRINSLDSQDVMDEIVEACRELGFDAASMIRLQSGGQEVKVTSLSGMPESILEASLSLDRGIARRVLNKGHGVSWYRDQIEQEGCPLLQESDFGAVHAEPVFIGDDVAAILFVGRLNSSAVSVEGRAALETLALEAGAALSNAEHYTLERLQALEYRNQSERDPLTGLANRRLADTVLPQVAPDDAVLLIDLDHFKWVNDSFGHDGGDKVLISLAEFLRAELREGDIPFRVGARNS